MYKTTFKWRFVCLDDHPVKEGNKQTKNVRNIFNEILHCAQNTVQNKSKKKKISPVLTSEEWQAYHTKIKEEKENKEKQVQERKRLRLEKKKQKEEEKKEKQIKLEEKKKLNEEIRKLMAMKKNIIQIKKEKSE